MLKFQNFKDTKKILKPLAGKGGIFPTKGPNQIVITSVTSKIELHLFQFQLYHFLVVQQLKNTYLL